MLVKIKPMTVNKCWRGGRRFRTKEYNAWEEELLWTLPKIEFPKENICLEITFGLSNSGSDVDNCAKPFLDVLQKKYDFNDNKIIKLTLIKQKVKKGEEYIQFSLK